MNQESKQIKSGFVAIIGRPNVGKSTLLNEVIGQKVAIMSDKPQTTRNKIRAVFTNEQGQIVFIDTPGVHKPKTKLGQYMMNITLTSLQEVDLILYLIDVTNKFGLGEQFILEQLKEVRSTPVFLILNKIDLVTPEQLLPIIEQYRSLFDFKEVIPISALKGNNVKTLLSEIFEELPEGPYYFPPDQVVESPERFIVAELIREKILHLTREEVPHSIAVVVESMKPGEENPNTVVIQAVIYTERPSQKAIIIGKSGSMLKEIGKKAREDIERLLGTKTFIELWVKVKEDWKNRDYLLKDFGYFEEND
ncbi:GTPase Era [Tepidibacillus decaturensis]|uniref:GTPase Era n=1 Tax=Tepidibacillus decaturensis TaxID=1413211 RepID=A0A135L2R1_9BACI|nr:GTPase Era [Tepidibacillus decaturensis]KXG43189.1 GTPase Era [Tepidibacillus decaturensis]